MKGWIGRLDPRERTALLVGAVALLGSLLYLLIWEPFHAHLAAMEQRVAEQRAALQWMRGAARDVLRLQGSARSLPGAKQGQSLLATVDETAKTGRLGPALRRIEPDGDNGVRVWLEQAAFDDLVLWLGKLRTERGVDVSTITVERQGAAGLVNARVTLIGNKTQPLG